MLCSLIGGCFCSADVTISASHGTEFIILKESWKLRRKKLTLWLKILLFCLYCVRILLKILRFCLYCVRKFFVLCEKGLQEVVGGLLRAFPFLNQCLSSFFSPLFLYSFLKTLPDNFSVSGDWDVWGGESRQPDGGGGRPRHPRPLQQGDGEAGQGHPRAHPQHHHPPPRHQQTHQAWQHPHLPVPWKGKIWDLFSQNSQLNFTV